MFFKKKKRKQTNKTCMHTQTETCYSVHHFIERSRTHRCLKMLLKLVNMTYFWQVFCAKPSPNELTSDHSLFKYSFVVLLYDESALYSAAFIFRVFITSTENSVFSGCCKVEQSETNY